MFEHKRVYRMAWIAAEIAYKVHKNQLRKDGSNYLDHIKNVAANFNMGSNRHIVSLLHDVVEDSDMTIEDLKNEGFSEEICAAVDSITRRESEKYFDYIDRVKINSIARDVKIADLKDNIDLSKFKTISNDDISRTKRYLKAMQIIKNHINEE